MNILELSEQEIVRRNNLQQLRDLGIDPYPAAEYPTDAFSTEIKENFVDLPTIKNEEGEEVPTPATPENSRMVCVAGRIMSKRVQGKAAFVELLDSKGRIQVYITRDALCPNPEDTTLYNVVFKKCLDLGDFIGIKGYVFRTKTGEITIHAMDMTVLAKSLKPLPVVKEKDGQVYDSFDDPELRYRQRYVDLIVNSGVKETFLKRSIILRTMRNILDEAGYRTSFMCGSDANFGGRKTYYTTHGTDKIYDIYTARKDGIVPGDYFVWWGMEDKHLFEYARQELTEISQGDEPFAFTMLTVDTHHIGGYQCSYCTDEFEETYEQSISCSSRQVLEFVNWLKAQPFWDNTTVVITGDHLSMDNGYFQRNVDEGYQRMVYNCIVNSAIPAENTKNREYCAVDLFPTTLAALGCTIEGDRLGLGTNLFSNLPTLAEKWGYDRFNTELGRASDYYIANFHNDPDA